MVNGGALRIGLRIDEAIEGDRRLLDSQGARVSLADTCAVRMSVGVCDSRVLSLDRKDFTDYWCNGREPVLARSGSVSAASSPP